MRRPHNARRPRIALLGALALGGCVVFDPELYQQSAAGITLAAIVRPDGFELFTHPGRVAPDEPSRQSHVA